MYAGYFSDCEPLLPRYLPAHRRLRQFGDTGRVSLHRRYSPHRAELFGLLAKPPCIGLMIYGHSLLRPQSNSALAAACEEPALARRLLLYLCPLE